MAKGKQRIRYQGASSSLSRYCTCSLHQHLCKIVIVCLFLQAATICAVGKDGNEGALSYIGSGSGGNSIYSGSGDDIIGSGEDPETTPTAMPGSNNKNKGVIYLHGTICMYKVLKMH